jgi:hypothetical protein
VELDTSGWSGDGALTQRLIEVIEALPHVRYLKVEDAPASRSDAGFSFISNELFVVFSSTPSRVRAWRLGFIPGWKTTEQKPMSLEGLESSLAVVDGIGPPDYSDEGMLQYLRAERVIPAYQTRGYKLVELVRIYESGDASGRGA